MRIDPGAVYNRYKKSVQKDQGQSSSKGKVSLSDGEKIKGEVLDAKQNSVKLRLSDGRVLDAKVINGSNFSIGEEVSFTVGHGSGDQIVLSMDLAEGEQLANQLTNLLKGANLPLTDENQALVKLMIQNNMPIDNKSLKDMVRLMNQFKDVPMKQLVFMSKHNIPITPENLEQMAGLENGEHSLMKGIASLAEDITTTKGLTEQEQSVLNVISEDKEVLSVLKDMTGVIKNLDEKTMVNGERATLLEGEAAGDAVKGDINAEGSLKGAHSLKDKGTLEDGSNITDGKQSKALFGNLKQESLNTPINQLVSDSQLDKLISQFSKSTGIKLSADTTLADFSNMLDKDLFTPEQLRGFLVELKEEGTYHTIAKGLLMTEKDLENVEQLKNYFEKLHEKVSTLIDSEQSGSIKGEGPFKEAANVKSSVEFMNALNQDFNLVHLPLLLGDRLLNSELYVLNDRKALKSNKETLTALVRLDLLNLGHTDIYVKKTAKNVDITFYMEDEQQIEVVRNKIYQLHKSLRDKGFNTLGIKVEPLANAFDVTKDFLEKDSDKTELKRYSFDMRA